ncbi:MAG: carbamoyltransferase HypF [Bacteroidales bacterium]
MKINQSYKIHVHGLVQGVGFRPFIYRLAREHSVSGWVENRNDGVVILAQGRNTHLTDFIHKISTEAPMASEVKNVQAIPVTGHAYNTFSIRKSERTTEAITDVSPDIAVCDRCLEDMKKQPHRLNYPLINCTHCGPRFTIIRDLPYDRHMTTMADFIMCSTCKKEYTDINNRRFHAQPVACNHCGPHYELIARNRHLKQINKILDHTCSLLESGHILAIKGLGGFNLVCDAINPESVNNLRKLKARDGKPFAVMFRDLNTVQEYTRLSEKEEQLLTSWRRPIVLLKTRKELAPDVSVGFDTTGAMLPYMPFHYLLFEKTTLPVLVFTSGNLSEEPIITENKEALQVFGDKARATIFYNRDIHNRTDDSVAFVVNDKERLIRRSRGFAPSPIDLSFNANNILATGAELVNCFCLGKERQAILSQHIGDLKNLETLDFFEESVSRMQKLFRVNPGYIAHDLHPNYLSTRYARSTGLPTIPVQHHHAHIASVMAEYGLQEKVSGIAFDGVGLGTDHTIWGGEFLIAGLNDFERFSSFEPVPMPGSDLATKEPWRMALSYLYHYYKEALFALQIPFVEGLNRENADLILKAIDRNINAPLTSSAGRLFDAVSALLGLCHKSSFHAEAPMRLENIIDTSETGSYSFYTGKEIGFRPLFDEIIQDIRNNTDPGIISARFHRTIINITFATAEKIRADYGIEKVVLSGGTFQNRYLLKNTEKILNLHGFRVYSPVKVPANDGGIALGQLAIAAAKLRSKQFSQKG